MSKQAVHAFIAKASKDKDLQAEIKKSPHAVVDVAKAHGHTFSKQDFDDVMSDNAKGGEQPHFCWGVDPNDGGGS